MEKRREKKNTTKRIAISVLTIGILAFAISSASAHPRTFDGNVYYENSTPCTAIDLVEITNTNTSETWNQSTLPKVIIAPGYSIYQLTIDEPNDVNVSDIMMYYAVCGVQTNTSYRTFTGSGVTSHDIILAGAPASTSTPTRASTTSSSSSHSPTPSPTPTPTLTPTPTQTATSTPAPTPTQTPIQTATPTLRVTPTPSLPVAVPGFNGVELLALLIGILIIVRAREKNK